MTIIVLSPAGLPPPLSCAPGRDPDACRIAGIDHLRGLVCLSITVGHLYADQLHTDVARYRPGTECFMVLSGFLLGRMLRPTDRPVSFVRFARRRLYRLIIPFVIAVTGCTLAFSVAAAVGRRLGYPNGTPLLWDAEWLADYLASVACASDLFGRQMPGAYWSMIVLIQATVLISGVYWLARHGFAAAGGDAERRAFVAVTAMIGVGFVASVGQSASRDIHTWWLVWNFAPLAAGWLLAAAHRSVSGWVAAVTSGGLAASGVWGLLTDPPAGVVPQPVRPILAAVTVFVLWWLRLRGGRPMPRLLGGLEVVGRRSYSVYLTHITAGGLVVVTARNLWPACQHGLPRAAAAAVAVAATAIVAEGFYRLVEQPMSRLASRSATPSARGEQPAPDTQVMRAPDTVRLPVFHPVGEEPLPPSRGSYPTGCGSAAEVRARLRRRTR